ncbi:MAG: hypothetical protein RLZ72_535 [Actinomycetota bacterium]|jgi:predicted dehydrogenase
MGKVHSRAYQAIPVTYPELGVFPDLIIAADTVEERGEYARNVLGYRESTTDYHDVINHPEVEVVSVCAPNFLHAEIGIAVAQAGKALWIEKPVGRNATDTAELHAAVVANNIITSIGFNYRHVPAIEYIRTLIADGKLGRITNVRGVFFADYSADARGVLSWRFVRNLAGSGVLGDLLGHLSDLFAYTVGAISDVSARTSIIHGQRPEASGAGTHFDVGGDGPLKDVENEDYAALLVQFGPDSMAPGAIGTLESSRVSIGNRARYEIEIFGTEGSVKWNFERLNEVELALGRNEPLVGYQRVMAGPAFGDFSHFQPGAGTSMGYDDLKIIEARKFLDAVVNGGNLNSNINDALLAARVNDAAEQSHATNAWVAIEPVAGTTSARR